MLDAFMLGAAAVAGWLAKDLAGRWLGRTVARSGRIGYAHRVCGFYCESVTENGQKLVAQYSPDNMFVEERVHYLRCTGDLYNDSDVPVLLTKPAVTFWRSDGPAVRHHDPKLYVGQDEPTVVTVPAHGITSIVITLPILRERLDNTYASTLPVLDIKDVNGRQHSFRLSSTSFHGELAAWPRKGQLPIFLLGRSRDLAETDEPVQLQNSDAPALPMVTSARDRAD